MHVIITTYPIHPNILCPAVQAVLDLFKDDLAGLYRVRCRFFLFFVSQLGFLGTLSISGGSDCLVSPGQALGIKLSERLAIAREQCGSFAPSAMDCRRTDTTKATVCGGGTCWEAMRLISSSGGGAVWQTESGCRMLWEIPAWEDLLAQGPCSVRSSSGTARGRGHLFVFEDSWIFAPARRTEPRRRQSLQCLWISAFKRNYA